MTLEGHAVTVAADGATALRRLRGRPTPELLLADLLLPGIGGREVVERLAAEPRSRRVPVVLVTATLRPELLPRAGTYHALLRKPFTLAAVLEAIRGALAPGPAGAPAAVGTPAP